MKNNPSSAEEQAAINGYGTTQSAARPHIDTEPFKKWFGDSKVVDAKGAPLVVYHGTASDHSIFSAYVGAYGKGIYMTSSSASAGGYSLDAVENRYGYDAPGEHDPGANVMPLYAAIRNPLRVEGKDSMEAVRQATGNADPRDVGVVLERSGHDGIWVTFDDGSPDELIAFHPNQIKSAIGNSGLYLKDSSSLTDHETALLLSNVAAAKSHIDGVFSCEARSRTKKVKP